jgi:OOP family OmpA-OmpF porin
VLGCLLVAGTASAETPADDNVVGHWYLAPKIGATITDHDRSVGDGVFYGLAIGKHLNEDWSAELNLLSGDQSGKQSAPGLRISTVSADVLRVFNRSATFAPYLTGGLGILEDDLQAGPSKKGALAQAGVGAFIRAWQNSSGATQFSLRPEAKVRWDANEYGGRRPVDVLIGVGFELAFGAPRAPAVTAAVPPPTPAPPPSAVPAPAQTAPLDSDRDGVLDASDRCPDTPRGIAVDASGCPIKGSITLVGVHFENNSATLTADSSAELDPIAASLKAHPRLRIELQGHTDSVGSDAYNLKLSQARAAAVRDYLVAQGAPAAALIAKGYGETQPVADNAKPEGRAQNRRVVMTVLDNPSDVEVKQSQ